MMSNYAIVFLVTLFPTVNAVTYLSVIDAAEGEIFDVDIIICNSRSSIDCRIYRKVVTTNKNHNLKVNQDLVSEHEARGVCLPIRLT